MQASSTPSPNGCWQQPNVRFGDSFFAHKESLDVYFAHYFPANLGKLQLVLLDLLRAGHFPERLHVVNLGVGPGTSFVAVLDFVLGWAPWPTWQGRPCRCGN